jgi:hypothetical protein
MMTVTQQREAQDSADRRAAAARDAADRRVQNAAQAAKDRIRAYLQMLQFPIATADAEAAVDQDAWDKRTGQGIYSSSPSSQPSVSLGNPTDAIRDQIDQVVRKIEGAD